MTPMQVSRTLNRVPAIVYLWIAIAIFAASNSVTREITQLGQNHLVNGRNPISLCNVLFVGNICAFGLMALIFHRDWRPERFGTVTRSQWIALTAIAILASALAPAMIFTALDQTNVTNVVLIGRLEPPLTLVLEMGLLGTRVNLWTIAGLIVSFLGIVATVSIPQSSDSVKIMRIHWGRGELLVAGAAIFLSISSIISQKYLRGVPFGIFQGYRTFLGTIVFFFLALYLYGADHFGEAFAPFLWQWMLIYALIIVVAGQLCWFKGLSRATVAEISLANSCNPVLAIAFAYLLLGEVPTGAQYTGGSIILVGIVFSAIGSFRTTTTPKSMMMGLVTGFRGV
jgi:drug/metabolite transporter (DMT)-like permease